MVWSHLPHSPQGMNSRRLHRAAPSVTNCQMVRWRSVFQLKSSSGKRPLPRGKMAGNHTTTTALAGPAECFPCLPASPMFHLALVDLPVPEMFHCPSPCKQMPCNSKGILTRAKRFRWQKGEDGTWLIRVRCQVRVSASMKRRRRWDTSWRSTYRDQNVRGLFLPRAGGNYIIPVHGNTSLHPKTPSVILDFKGSEISRSLAIDWRSNVQPPPDNESGRAVSIGSG